MRAECHELRFTVLIRLECGLIKQVEVYDSFWRSRSLDPVRQRHGTWMQGYILDAGRVPEFAWRHFLGEHHNIWSLPHPLPEVVS